MGRFNNDIINIIVQLRYTYNIAIYNKQYVKVCYVSYDNSISIETTQRSYNWRHLYSRFYIGGYIWNKHGKKVGHIPKNY